MKFKSKVNTKNRTDVHGETAECPIIVQNESILTTAARGGATVAATIFCLYGAIVAVEKIEHWRNKAKCSKTKEKTEEKKA
jgi:hypothetical protein